MIDKEARKFLAEQRDKFLAGEEVDQAEGYIAPDQES
jgi:Fe-S cluster biosynthesis and repair protein YggX